MNKKSITFSVLFILMIFLSSCGTKSDAVSIIGTWGGTELENFKKICASAGVKIKFETTRDLNSLLETRLKSENTPDIAILPNPAKLVSLAKRGYLRPLSFLSKKKLTKDYIPYWLKMGSYAGKLYGLFYKAANKSIIWYNPQ
ncbi:MAG: carbohydrate ABC transporter substrate-binding protein, partial [Spirochaetes bacterium]|nr:carbohydrate ABC transporter substrate-binding protein [Spirochaetota bacterium]